MAKVKKGGDCGTPQSADAFFRLGIRGFLQDMLASVEKSHAEHRAAAKGDDSARTKGVLLYQSHQISTIKWLLSVNDQAS